MFETDPDRSPDADPIDELDGYRPPENDLFAFGWVPFEERWDGDGRPPLGAVFGHGYLPQLSLIHPRRWAEVMAPYDRAHRTRIALCQGLTLKERSVADAVLRRLPPPAQEIARDATRAKTLPDAGTAGRPVTRQVNVRIGAREHEDLAAAAEIAGTSPTTFARWLIVAGARRTLADHAAAYGDTRSRS